MEFKKTNEGIAAGARLDVKKQEGRLNVTSVSLGCQRNLICLTNAGPNRQTPLRVNNV